MRDWIDRSGNLGALLLMGRIQESSCLDRVRHRKQASQFMCLVIIDGRSNVVYVQSTWVLMYPGTHVTASQLPSTLRSTLRSTQLPPRRERDLDLRRVYYFVGPFIRLIQLWLSRYWPKTRLRLERNYLMPVLRITRRSRNRKLNLEIESLCSNPAHAPPYSNKTISKSLTHSQTSVPPPSSQRHKSPQYPPSHQHVPSPSPNASPPPPHSPS